MIPSRLGVGGPEAKPLRALLWAITLILMSKVMVVSPSPDDPYWQSITEQSIFFFDDVSQRLYMYPNSLTAYDLALIYNVSCAYREYHPATFSKPPPGSMYYQDVGVVGVNGSVVWNETVLTYNAPPLFLRQQQSIYIAQKRALVVLGGYELWQFNSSASPPPAAILESCTNQYGWATNYTQCLVPHKATYILWLENMTWSSLSYDEAGFPEMDNATLMDGGALAMFQARLSGTYDWVHDQLYAFGGYLYGQAFNYCEGSTFTYPLWMFSFESQRWAVLPTTNGICVGYALPVDPLRGMFVYNSLKHQLVSYSGVNNWEGITSYYCFVLDLATLNWLSSADCAPFTGPTPVFDATYFYSPDYTGVYLAGGQFDAPGYPGTLYWADPSFWFLDFRTYTWSIATVQTSVPVGVHFSQTKAAVDAKAGVVYMWGGVLSTAPASTPFCVTFDYSCETRVAGFWKIPASLSTKPNTIFVVELPEPLPGRSVIPESIRGVYILLACLMLSGCLLGIHSLRQNRRNASWAPLEAKVALLFPDQSVSRESTASGTTLPGFSINERSFDPVSMLALEFDRSHSSLAHSDASFGVAADYAVTNKKDSRKACTRCPKPEVVIILVALANGTFLLSHVLDVVYDVYMYTLPLAVIFGLLIVVDAVIMATAVLLSAAWPAQRPAPSVRRVVWTLFIVSAICIISLCGIVTLRKDPSQPGWPAVGWCLLGGFLVSSLLTRFHVIQNEIFTRLHLRDLALAGSNQPQAAAAARVST